MADCPGLRRRLESDHIILLIALLLNCEKAGIGGRGKGGGEGKVRMISMVRMQADSQIWLRIIASTVFYTVQSPDVRVDVRRPESSPYTLSP